MQYTSTPENRRKYTRKINCVEFLEFRLKKIQIKTKIMKYVIVLIFSVLVFGCSKPKSNQNISESENKIVNVVQYEDLKSVLLKNDNVLYVVNFWATWCSPCVKEIPDFMEVNNKLKARKDFKMILVSLDNVKELENTVKPFIINKEITADVYLLDDNKRMNEWIPSIDANWTGSIPATVFYKNGIKLHFVEDQITKVELEQIINQYL